MLLEKIKLENFRQFIEGSIDFADGRDGKNVTIIIGENASGKTTFAQAFLWCMYGETDFADKMLLNRKKAESLTPSQKATVSVTLTLKHGELEYTLTRKQDYYKDYDNNMKSDNAIFDIMRKGKDGNTVYLKKTEIDSTIRDILPKELSRYFFFDGERIQSMSKDISSGKRSTDFAQAVNGLLGLNAMAQAIDHFNPRSKYCVIGSYEDVYNTSSNQEIIKYTNDIAEYNKKITEIDQSIEELDEQREKAESEKSSREKEIRQYEEGAALQERKEECEKKIERYKELRATSYKTICKTFNDKSYQFFSVNLIQRAMDTIKDKDFVGSDIPYIREETCRYLLHRKTCICGTQLTEGSLPYQKVEDLCQYIAPNNISNLVHDFKQKSKERVNTDFDMKGSLLNSMNLISGNDTDIMDQSDEVKKIDNKLSGGDVLKKVNQIHKIINQCEDILKRNKIEHDRIIEEKGACKTNLSTAESSRSRLTLLDKKNRDIEIYKAYAEEIYSELQTAYSTSEKEVRDRLEKTINDIFKQIYAGELRLEIDDKYHISVFADEYSGDVETSTAQSISVIFAFITGIIKMARENRNSDDENAKLLSSEPYPLVMDAPLSAFDKRRIKTVCDTLPKTAEQVIIFIKDTDGDLAEEYMGNKIGSRHQFDKIDEFETKLN